MRKKISLTKLEGEVMKAVWDAGIESISVRELVDAVNQNRKKKLAYNTVQTMVMILKEKQILKQVASSGRAHRFKAKISRIEAGRHLVGDMAQRLFDGQLQPLIHRLIDDAKLTASELAELRKYVESKLKDADPDGGQL